MKKKRIVLMLLILLLAAGIAGRVPVPVYAANIAEGTCGSCTWVIDEDGTLTISPADGTSGTLASNSSSSAWPWYDNRTSVKKIVIEAGVKAGTSLSYAFYGMESCTGITCGGFDTGSVADMSRMFYGCSSLADVSGLSGWDTGNVTNMTSMFFNCSSLPSVSALSDWDTENVTNMNYMFRGCSTFSDISGLSDWDTGSVTNMGSMFYGCSTLSDISGLSDWDTGNVTKMNYMFDGCSSLADTSALADWDTGKVTSMSAMFQTCSSLADVSGLSDWDTGKVTDMTSMFYNCSSLTDISALSDWNTGNVTITYAMFQNCTSLEKADLSGWDTGKATTMSNMLTGCSRLREVTLGENFTFKGNGTSPKTKLPTPPSAQDGVRYTGKWIREDGTYGPFTPSELADGYAPAMAGKWVWETDSSYIALAFDANGGHTTAVGAEYDSEDAQVQIPDASTTTRLHYTLTSWNTEADGSGTSYEPGSVHTDVLKKGRKVTLYAQWEETNIRDYRVEHYQQTLDLTGYDLADSEVFHAPKDEPVTPEVKTYPGFISPQEQTVEIADDDSTVVSYYYDREAYTVSFNRNTGTSGIMRDMKMVCGVSYDLPKNTYSKEGGLFTGWNTMPDGSGTSYPDMSSVKDLTTISGSSVTLYAQWMANENVLTAQDGAVTVTLKAGETIVIPDLPAGTTYRIEEVDVPDGWEMEETDNGEGVIFANRASSGHVRNSYHAEGFIELSAYKRLEGRTLQEGEFRFELTDEGGNVLDVQTTGPVSDALVVGGEIYRNAAAVTFDAIYYTEDDIGRTYTYKIREAAGGEDDVVYDRHEETVRVTVTDAGRGILLAEAEYDDDGPLFTNSIKTTSMKITKDLQDVSEQMAGTDFDFKVTFRDRFGQELTGAYTCRVNRKSTQTVNEEKTVMSGDTIVMNAGEEAVITGLPYGTAYSVEEAPRVNWSLVESHDTTGILGPEGGTASFTNTYGGDLAGSAVIEADKVFRNGDITSQEFAFVLTDSEGNEISRAGSDSNGHVRFPELAYTLSDVGTHTYHIKEEADSTKGYIRFDPHTETVTVNVADNGHEALDTEVVYDGDGALFTNVYEQTIRLHKVDEAGGGVKGAVITLTSSADLSGVSVSGAKNVTKDVHEVSFTTDGGEITISGLPSGTFTFTETGVPSGYAAAEPVTVSDPDVEDVTMVDLFDYIEVPVSKQDIAGSSIPGAVLEITGTDAAGREIEKITLISASSTGTAMLHPGSYVLHEAAVPDASVYAPADDIAFTIGMDGTITVAASAVTQVAMTDPYVPHKVYVSKLEPHGRMLPGAQLTITGRDAAGTDITPVQVTSGTEASEVELMPGDYTLTETSMPEGFAQADPVLFRVMPSGTVYVKRGEEYVLSDNAAVVMTDPVKVQSISISKRVTGNMGNKAHDFSFVLELTGEYVPEKIAYTKGGESGELTLESGRASFLLGHGETITFTGIPYGTAYKVTEADGETNGYEVTSENTEGTVTADVSVSFRNNKGHWVPTDLAMPQVMTAIAFFGGAGILMFMFLKKRAEGRA